MPRFRIPIIDIISRSIRKFTESLSIPDISIGLYLPEGTKCERAEEEEKREGRRLTNEQEVNQFAV
jgi:hypothetical protein